MSWFRSKKSKSEEAPVCEHKWDTVEQSENGHYYVAMQVCRLCRQTKQIHHEIPGPNPKDGDVLDDINDQFR